MTDADVDADPDVDAVAPWADDAVAVRAFWQGLDLPDLIDLHAHFLPPPIEKAVWREFDAGGALIGRAWPIRYRDTIEHRVEFLRAAGVRGFTTLPYAHKPGVAGFLNDWSRDFAADVPEALRSATFFPEADAASYVPEAIADGVRVFKLHLQVGGYHLDDPQLEPVWGPLAEAGTPVMVHAGSGPVGTPFTGPASMARVLARHPRLRLVVAHMGAPEFVEFVDLAGRHERVCLDTSMAFTDFFADGPHGGRFPQELVARLADLQDRVLWGSDFPTLPFAYRRQLDEVAELGLGEEWLRSVCWSNALRLIGPTTEIS